MGLEGVGQSQEKCDDRSRGQSDMRLEAKDLLKLGKTKSSFFPRTSGRNVTNTMISAPLSSFWTSDIQNCKIMNLGCFKPLNLW